MEHGKPHLVSRKADISRALRREDEAVGLGLRGWIRSIIEEEGDPRFARTRKPFSVKLSSPRRVRVSDEVIELPVGSEVTVFRYLGAEPKRWPTSSDKTLAVVIIRGIADHQDRQITITMTGATASVDL